MRRTKSSFHCALGVVVGVACTTFIAAGCGSSDDVSRDENDSGARPDASLTSDSADDASVDSGAAVADGSSSPDAAVGHDEDGSATDSGAETGTQADGGDGGPAPASTYLALIGDSITAGDGATTDATRWTALLATKLGPSFAVGAFGESGTTMMKVSDDPYWSTPGLTNAESFLAGAGAGSTREVMIMLGTNDAKDDTSGVDNWNSTAPTRYPTDYGAMIDALQAAAPGVKVFLALPPPAFSYDYDIDPTVVAQQVVPAIRTLAAQRGLPVVDVFDALDGDGSDFPDGIHPDDTGQALVAQAVYDGLVSPLLDGGP